IHRGIAARQFQRGFVLAEGIEVVKASLDNGLLSIDLARPLVEPKIKTIPINQGEACGSAIDMGPCKRT
nr:Hsp20 family protein [Alphaproteobacteria bacterium]